MSNPGTDLQHVLLQNGSAQPFLGLCGLLQPDVLWEDLAFSREETIVAASLNICMANRSYVSDTGGEDLHVEPPCQDTVSGGHVRTIFLFASTLFFISQ